MKKRLVRAILSMVIILSMFENVISIPHNTYAESDSYGNSITKTIQSETSSGVTFQIDWLFSGGINTGATIVDNFDNNLSFISKSDGLLSSMANFTTGGNALTWTFTQSTGNTISGSILANFSKDDFDDYTNSANLSGGIYSCIDNPQHDFVTTEYTIEAPIVSTPATDLMIQKRAGSCVPPGPPPANGIITGYRGDMIGWTCSNAKVNYNIGDYVYYTLYVHNIDTNEMGTNSKPIIFIYTTAG